jgi:hypothetical protein
VKAQWSEVLKAMQCTRENLYVLSQVYGLDPIEEKTLKAQLADKLTELAVPARKEPAAKTKSPTKEKATEQGKSLPKPKDADKPLSKTPRK